MLKVVNAAGEPVDVALDLKGAANLAPTAKALVLTSANPDDENSFDEPGKVSPKAEVIQNISANFRHTFPANSVTVLRFRQ